MKYVGKKTIWLISDDNPFEISENKIVLTDLSMYKLLIEELNDISNQIKIDINSKASSDYLTYSDYNNVYSYNPQQSSFNYINPREKVRQLLTGNFFSNFDMLNLFATLQFGDNKEKQINEFKRAQKILKKLEDVSLDPTTFSIIIEKMWPNFGFYAVKGLKCTDVIMQEKFNILEIEFLLKNSKRSGAPISDKLLDVLSKREEAKTNGEVLSLAKKVHKLTI